MFHEEARKYRGEVLDALIYMAPYSVCVKDEFKIHAKYLWLRRVIMNWLTAIYECYARP